MVKLNTKYGESGLNIIAFPCNQFMFQEPHAAPAIKRSASKLGFDGEGFFVMEKVCVQGKDISPVFAFLRATTDVEITWNFGAYFLVDRNGTVQGFPKVSPKALTERIEYLVKMEPPASAM